MLCALRARGAGAQGGRRRGRGPSLSADEGMAEEPHQEPYPEQADNESNSAVSNLPMVIPKGIRPELVSLTILSQEQYRLLDFIAIRCLMAIGAP